MTAWLLDDFLLCCDVEERFVVFFITGLFESMLFYLNGTRFIFELVVLFGYRANTGLI